MFGWFFMDKSLQEMPFIDLEYLRVQVLRIKKYFALVTCLRYWL